MMMTESLKYLNIEKASLTRSETLSFTRVGQIAEYHC